MLDTIPDKNASYSTSKNLISPKRSYVLLRLLSIEGRIGRFTYFFYSIVSPFLLFWVMAASAGVIGKMGEIGNAIAYILLLLTVLSMVYIVIQLTIKRCHDFNASGWVSPLILIPFAYMFFCLMPGNIGINKYGEASDSPSNLLKTGCLILIAFLVATMTYHALMKLL